jgi:hypothetical protein
MSVDELRQICTQQLQTLYRCLHSAHITEKPLVATRRQHENLARQFIAHVFSTCSTTMTGDEFQQRAEVVGQTIQMVCSCWHLHMRSSTLREVCTEFECLACYDEQVRADHMFLDLAMELETAVCMRFEPMYAHIKLISREAQLLLDEMRKFPMHEASRSNRTRAPFLPVDN